MAFKMLLSLAVGIKEAAFYVALCFVDGFGAVQNEFLENILYSVIKGYAEFVELDSGSTSQTNSTNPYADQTTSLLTGQHQHNNADDSCCIIL